MEEVFHSAEVSCKNIFNTVFLYPFLSMWLRNLSWQTNEMQTSAKVSGKSAMFPSSSRVKLS